MTYLYANLHVYLYMCGIFVCFSLLLLFVCAYICMNKFYCKKNSLVMTIIFRYEILQVNYESLCAFFSNDR